MEWGPYDLISFIDGAAAALSVALIAFVVWIQWIGRR